MVDRTSRKTLAHSRSICRPDHIATRCGIGDFQLVGLFPCQPQLFGFQFISGCGPPFTAPSRNWKGSHAGTPEHPQPAGAFCRPDCGSRRLIGLGANLTRGDAQEGGKAAPLSWWRYRLSDCHLIAGRLSAGSGGMGSRNQGRPLSGPLIMQAGAGVSDPRRSLRSVLCCNIALPYDAKFLQRVFFRGRSPRGRSPIGRTIIEQGDDRLQLMIGKAASPLLIDPVSSSHSMFKASATGTTGHPKGCVPVRPAVLPCCGLRRVGNVPVLSLSVPIIETVADRIEVIMACDPSIPRQCFKRPVERPAPCCRVIVHANRVRCHAGALPIFPADGLRHAFEGLSVPQRVAGQGASPWPVPHAKGLQRGRVIGSPSSSVPPFSVAMVKAISRSQVLFRFLVSLPRMILASSSRFTCKATSSARSKCYARGVPPSDLVSWWINTTAAPQRVNRRETATTPL